jgi:hypothetical protein
VKLVSRNGSKIRKSVSSSSRMPQKTGNGFIWTARASQESPFGTTIARGFLTLSLISHLMKSDSVSEQCATDCQLRSESRALSCPCTGGFQDSRVYCGAGYEGTSDSVEAIYVATIERENCEKPSCVAEWAVRYYL